MLGILKLILKDKIILPGDEMYAAQKHAAVISRYRGFFLAYPVIPKHCNIFILTTTTKKGNPNFCKSTWLDFSFDKDTDWQ